MYKRLLTLTPSALAWGPR